MDKLSKEATIALIAAEKAGELLMQQWGKQISSTKKKDQSPVTVYDHASEEIIKNILHKQFPADSFYGEETTKDRTAKRVWVIDPIDGTFNFMRGFPEFCISIALIEQGKTTLGIILLPATGDLYHAKRGEGAMLNGKKLNVSRVKELSQASAYPDGSFSSKERKKATLRIINHFCPITNHIRILGSSVLGLTYLAAGRFDLYISEGAKPWDHAAASLLIQEAGGKVTSFGKPVYDPFSCGIVATNGKLHSLVIKELGKIS